MKNFLINVSPIHKCCLDCNDYPLCKHIKDPIEGVLLGGFLFPGQCPKFEWKVRKCSKCGDEILGKHSYFDHEKCYCEVGNSSPFHKNSTEFKYENHKKYQSNKFKDHWDRVSLY